MFLDKPDHEATPEDWQEAVAAADEITKSVMAALLTVHAPDALNVVFCVLPEAMADYTTKGLSPEHALRVRNALAERLAHTLTHVNLTCPHLTEAEPAPSAEPPVAGGTTLH